MEYRLDIELFRKSNKMTQIDAAKYFGCKQGFISRMETGKSSVPPAYIEKVLADDALDKSAITVKENDKNISEECMTVINRQLSLIEKRDEQIDRLLTIIENFKKV